MKMDIATHYRLMCAVLLALCVPAGAAVIMTEAFDVDVASWTAGGASLDYSAAGGNPGGALGITVEQSGAPVVAAFQANNAASGGAFAGSYTSVGATFFTFDFQATDYAPLSLALRLTDGTNNFLYALAPPTTTSWTSFSVPLSYPLSWVGGSSASFASALSSVSSVSIQFATQSDGEQTYRVDNVGLNTNPLPVVPTSIPEPGTLLLVLFGVGGLMAGRRGFFRGGRVREG
jgi:hypothetical protein